MNLHGRATLLLAALVGLCGQRADATRGFSLDTPATSLQALATSITETPTISADTLDVDAWYVTDIIPLGLDDDGQHIELVTFLVPRSVLGELSPTATRAGPSVAPETHTPVFRIVKSPLGLKAWKGWVPRKGRVLGLLGRTLGMFEVPTWDLDTAEKAKINELTVELTELEGQWFYSSYSERVTLQKQMTARRAYISTIRSWTPKIGRSETFPFRKYERNTGWWEGIGGFGAGFENGVAVGLAQTVADSAFDDPSQEKTPDSRAYDRPETERASGRAVKDTDAGDDWDNFLGPDQTDIDPRDRLSDPDRIWSEDGTRSIRYGDHEMGSKPNKDHYHRETWHGDQVDNELQRIQRTGKQ